MQLMPSSAVPSQMKSFGHCLLPGLPLCECLRVTEFDNLRVVCTSVLRLSKAHEAHVLRRRLQEVSVVAHWTRLPLGDILMPSRWSSLRRAAGWISDGDVGRSLDSLREGLTYLFDMWNNVLEHRVEIEDAEPDVRPLTP